MGWTIKLWDFNHGFAKLNSNSNIIIIYRMYIIFITYAKLIYNM